MSDTEKLMNLEGRELFKKAAELEKAGMPVIICTVVYTEGSTPRKPGTHMIVAGNGESFGTVGGGRVEHLCLDHAMKMHASGTSKELSRFLSFNMNSADNEGLVCGGQAAVVFWQPENEDGQKGFFSRLLEVTEDQGGWLVLDYRASVRRFKREEPRQEKAETESTKNSDWRMGTVCLMYDSHPPVLHQSGSFPRKCGSGESDRGAGIARRALGRDRHWLPDGFNGSSGKEHDPGDGAGIRKDKGREGGRNPGAGARGENGQ